MCPRRRSAPVAIIASEPRDKRARRKGGKYWGGYFEFFSVVCKELLN